MIAERVRKVVASNLKVALEKVTLESSLSEDLGADSIDAVELIMALEDEFGITVSDDEAQEVKTVGDLVRFIENTQK